MATTHRQALAWEARTSRRRRALLGATLRTAAGERRTNILNLSSGGALLDAAEPPVADEIVTLIRGTISATGRVTWINGHRFGMQFDAAIAEEDVRLTVERIGDEA